jgi:hypothetical protein
MHLFHNRLKPRKHRINGLSSQLNQYVSKSLVFNDHCPYEIPRGWTRSREHSKVSNSLKLSQRDAREQSVSSFVVRIMELQMNRSDPSTRSIERNIETDLLDVVPNTLRIC